jgi:hypothetical protein
MYSVTLPSGFRLKLSGFNQNRIHRSSRSAQDAEDKSQPNHAVGRGFSG